jgi:hypothetical protein
MIKNAFPESVRPQSYTLLGDFKLNAWMLVAVLTDFALNWWLLPGHPDWSGPLRAAVGLAPLIPSFLWARSLIRWIDHMDELQRSIQVEGWLFGAIGTVFVTTAINLLESAHVLPTHGFGWTGSYVLMVILYVVGLIVANRRYQ